MKTIAKAASPRCAVVCSAVACVVILTRGMIIGGEGDTLRPPEPGSPATNSQPPAFSLQVEQARRHPSYLVFTQHVVLPVIAAEEISTLSVGGNVKIDVTRLDQLTHQQRETLAGCLDVPVGVIDRVLKRFSTKPEPDLAEMVQTLRITIVDYKYLQEKWTRRIPPSGQEKLKNDALHALQVGEIDRAWEMYISLPRPGPPTLRGVFQQ